MMKFAAFALCFFLGISSGCQLINPSEPIPTFLRIDSVRFHIQDKEKEGSAHQQIQCAWVYLDNQALGVFDLPAQIPILSPQPGLLRVVPGVVFAGMKDYLSAYPFFQADTLAFYPDPGKEIHWQPETRYFPDLRFAWKEDFEVGNSWIPVHADMDDDTSIHRVNLPHLVFEGSGSGMIALDREHAYSENITNSGFPLPEANTYVEIHYKSTVPFELGILCQGNGQVVTEYLYGVHPSEEWNKLYFGLNSFLGTFKGSSYRLMIRSQLPEGQESGYVLMDNIKVISF